MFSLCFEGHQGNPANLEDSDQPGFDSQECENLP